MSAADYRCAVFGCDAVAVAVEIAAPCSFFGYCGRHLTEQVGSAPAPACRSAQWLWPPSADLLNNAYETETLTMPETSDFRKTVRLGTIPTHDSAAVSVYARIEYVGGRLSISGVEGPRPSGNAYGSCGQIDMGYRTDAERAAITPAPGWDRSTIGRFFDAWGAWHLNDMRAGCEHQRAEGWQDRPIDPDKPTDTYGIHYPGQQTASWNLLGWVRPDEHPDGLLTAPCPTCGYKYGTAWVREEVPADVLDFLRGLPDADRTPAWV